MKKIATLFAVGVVALGASAQADQVSSTEYAVITIPVVSGDNLVGISVAADATTLSTLLPTLDSATTVKVWNGSSYSSVSAATATVSAGEAVFVSAAEAGFLYELGTVPSEAASVDKSVSGTMGIVASPFAAAWPLSSVASAFSTDGSSRYATANKIHVWNGSGYNTFWYKAGTGWKSKTSGVTVPSAIGAGQGVFVEFGKGAANGTISFAAPQ